MKPGDAFATVNSLGIAYQIEGSGVNPLVADNIYDLVSFGGLGYVFQVDNQLAADGYITPTSVDYKGKRGVLLKGYVTDPSQDAWIAINVGAQAVVSHVAVFVAADQYGNTLQHSEVRIGDDLTNIENNAICDYQRTVFQYERSTQRPYMFYCATPLKGQYVIVRRRTMGLLPVAEILAF